MTMPTGGPPHIAPPHIAPPHPVPPHPVPPHTARPHQVPPHQVLPTAPGWYPEPDDAFQRWWDGTAWTGYRRVSRFPGFVVRRGQVTFTGRRLFPQGDDPYPRHIRTAQAMLFGALFLIVLGLPISIAGTVLVGGELSLAPVLVPLLLAMALMLAAFVPIVRAYRVGQGLRDALARGDFYLELGPDGAPRATPAHAPHPPGW